MRFRLCPRSPANGANDETSGQVGTNRDAHEVCFELYQATFSPTDRLQKPRPPTAIGAAGQTVVDL